MNELLRLLNLDLDSQAKGEANALNSTRTKFDSYDLGDKFRSIITGVSKDDLEKRATELADAELTERYKPQASRNAARLGDLTAQYQGVSGRTREEIEADLKDDSGRATALEQTTASNPDFDEVVLLQTLQLEQL